MPVETKHPEYNARADQWERCRDAIEGEDAVKKAGTKYLPALDSHSHEVSGTVTSHAYTAYKKRAMFYGASGRTAEGLTGAVFRKPPKVDFPNRLQDWLESASQDGKSFEVFAKKVLYTVVAVGRHGVLLDLPEETQAQPVPYLSSYATEKITNWQTDAVDGREVLTMVVLAEKRVAPKIDDPFEVEVVDQFRVLRLGDPVAVLERQEALGGSAGIIDADAASEAPGETARRRYGSRIGKHIYFQEVWEKMEGVSKVGQSTTEYFLKNILVPRVRGQALDYIPFVFFGATELSSKPPRPPILPIVDVNLSHYRNSADLEHGRHYTALPTAYASGFSVREGQSLHIGSTTAWVSDEPGASVGFLEFTGKGLGHIADGMKDKESLMAILGARMLEEPKAAVEAADTHRVRRSGEEATLASIAGTVEAGFQILLKWASMWMIASDSEVTLEFNKDFVAIVMPEGLLTSLTTLLQSGRISYDTFFYNLEKGELLPEGRTLEEELDLIDQNPPTPPTVTLDDDDDEDEDEDEDETIV